ncbi:MAG: hypothetical protein ACKKMW_02125 [Candidatus Nealsonbacteria bacterium]
MNKIKNLLKKSPIAMVVIGLVITSVVSAALVDYLSNTVKADITVESPIVVGISLGLEGWDADAYPAESHNLADWTTTGTLSIDGTKGGEAVTLYTMSANMADAHIWGYEEAIVTNPLGVTCADFESVTVRVDSIYGDLGYGKENDALPICVQVDANTVKFDSKGNGATSDWNVGETDVSKIVVTFKSNALGTYGFTNLVVPVE